MERGVEWRVGSVYIARGGTEDKCGEVGHT